MLHAAIRYPEWMKAAILVDSGFGPPPASEGFRSPQMRNQPNRIYPTLEEALARFRFMPPQGCSNLFIADYIARRSLKEVPIEGGGTGWTWRFDPFLWSKLDHAALGDLFDQIALKTPTVHIYGDDSEIIRMHHGRGGRRLPDSVKSIVIPNSEHHIMVDQPLALVAALRSVLTLWP